MDIQLSEDSETALTDYARIPIAYEVHSVLIASPRGKSSHCFRKSCDWKIIDGAAAQRSERFHRREICRDLQIPAP